ncbi:MAG: 4-hydroxy-tetrahydrodipicolinate synthase [Treponemataceae bacterium]|nr:4-hydroxy-tetrahydrodipicolinate synthase [Treponemataceae bacterium]
MIALRGALTAMVTPMNADGSVDYEGFRKNVAFQLEKGIDGLVPLGTTGETPTLAEDEEERMITIVLEAVRAHEERTGRRVPVVVGAGSNNTADAVRYCTRAKTMGADAALVVTPYYNKPSDEGIFRHFEAVARVGIPIVVYNIAGRTGKNIPTPLLARIAALPNVIGVKEASGDINQMMAVIATVKAKRPDFAVLSGDDALTLPLVALGGDGIVSVVSNLAPAEVTEMTAAALSGDMEKARALHYRLLPFFKAAFVDGNPTSIKYAMNCKGMPAGTVRLPLVEVTDAAKQVIADALRESGL